jgi:hypothetical protein
VGAGAAVVEAQVAAGQLWCPERASSSTPAEHWIVGSNEPPSAVGGPARLLQHAHEDRPPPTRRLRRRPRPPARQGARLSPTARPPRPPSGERLALPAPTRPSLPRAVGTRPLWSERPCSAIVRPDGDGPLAGEMSAGSSASTARPACCYSAMDSPPCRRETQGRVGQVQPARLPAEAPSLMSARIPPHGDAGQWET